MAAVTVAKVLPRQASRLRERPLTNRLAKVLPRKPKRLRRNRGLPTVTTRCHEPVHPYRFSRQLSTNRRARLQGRVPYPAPR
jgi:hypothetical protein